MLATIGLKGDPFEVEAIRSAPSPPSFWKRYVDDTFTILESSKKEEFLEHLNSIDQQIQFTAEEPREDGAMPFLDILVTPRRDGSLSTTVYRKPTHTDLYLPWESHHPLSSKYSVIGTLQHRANTICSNPQVVAQRRETPAPGTDEMSIPQLGPEQSQTQDEKSWYNNYNQQDQ